MGDEAMEELSAADRSEIVAVCTEMAWRIDNREWEELARLFTGRVAVDYTSAFGGRAGVVPAGTFVGQIRSVLDHLTATQHLVASHVVTPSVTGATCTSQVQATHVRANRTGGAIWTGSGRYTMPMARGSGPMERGRGGWRIAGVTFTMLWASGNQEVMRPPGATATRPTGT